MVLQKTFYIASRVSNVVKVRRLRDKLVARGMRCIADWTLNKTAIRKPYLTYGPVNAAYVDEYIRAAASADLFVLLAENIEGARGAYVKFGAALGALKNGDERRVAAIGTPDEVGSSLFCAHSRLELYADTAQLLEALLWKPAESLLA